MATNYQVKHCDEFNLSQQTHGNVLLSIFYNEETYFMNLSNMSKFPQLVNGNEDKGEFKP